jgi:arylsulfatase A-like enzyme
MKTNKTGILLTALFFVLYTGVESFAQQTKPNIIFILADDMGYGDAGCYGSALIKTPNIDALAKSGIRFTDFYAGSTVCAPSRATLMTGQHTGHTFIRGNGEVSLRVNDSILPQMLHEAGYKNGMFGKWGLGQAGTAGSPEKKGWDFFSGLLHHVEGHYQKPDSAWQLVNGQCQKIKIPHQQYSNEWFTNEAIGFINRQQKSPFFLYLSFTLPLAELVVPGKFIKQYLNTDSSSKFGPETPQKPGLHYGSQQYPKAAYAAMVSQMDNYVGELVSAIKKLKLTNNTVFIFTSDNGTHTEGGRTKADVEFFKSSALFRGVKRDLYEGGIRVPCIISWNGKIQPGTVNDHTGAFWDLLPTITELAGLKKEINNDGISFVSSLFGKQQPQHEFLYWEFYENGFKQAVRKGNWKAIRFYKDKTTMSTVLYDLGTDIGEANNVATQYPEMVKQMEAVMDKEHIPSAHPLFQVK